MGNNKHIKGFNEHRENLNVSDVISRFSDEDIRQILFEYSNFLRENDWTFDLNTKDKWRKEFDTRNMVSTNELISLFLNDL